MPEPREPTPVEQIASLLNIPEGMLAEQDGLVGPPPETSYEPVASRRHLGGDSHIYHFDNGYMASVIRNKTSYGHDAGLWELAVMDKTRMVYDTPITDDVLGWLDDAAVQDLLVRIEALPPRTQTTGR